jgi:hypothetical protein
VHNIILMLKPTYLFFLSPFKDVCMIGVFILDGILDHIWNSNCVDLSICIDLLHL